MIHANPMRCPPSAPMGQSCVIAQEETHDDEGPCRSGCEGYASLRQRVSLFRAPAKDAGIAAFQAHDGLAKLR